MKHQWMILALLVAIPVAGVASLVALRQCATRGAAPPALPMGTLGIGTLPCGHRLVVEAGVGARIANQYGRFVLPEGDDYTDLSKKPSGIFGPGITAIASVGDVWFGECELSLGNNQSEKFWFIFDGSTCTFTRFKELHEAIVHAADRQGVKWPVLRNPMDYAE